MLVFSTQLCDLYTLPCCPSPLLSGSTLPSSPPLTYVKKYTVDKYTMCKGARHEILGLRQINTCRKVPLQVNFFKWRHFALLSMSLIFLRVKLIPLIYGARICKPFKEARNRFPALAGRYDNPIWRTGPPGYTGSRNRFIGIYSWCIAPVVWSFFIDYCTAIRDT